MSIRKERKKLLGRMPTNYNFWRQSLSNPKDVNSFLERGNERQHTCMIRTLNWLRRYDKEYYEKINGKEILKRLKAEEDNAV